MKTYQQFNESVKDWWNKGKNERIPNEDQASFKTLFKDDQAQKGMDSDNYKNCLLYTSPSPRDRG